jgi:isopropylmalate/homocitrate/citramalate synthase
MMHTRFSSISTRVTLFSQFPGYDFTNMYIVDNIESAKGMEVEDTMSELVVNDCTLREGEQAAAANFSLSDKLAIAERLRELGVEQLQAGYPGRSADDAAAVSPLRELGFSVEVICQAFTEDWQDQLDRCIDSSPDIIDIMYPASSLRLEYVQQVDEPEVLHRIQEAVSYVSERSEAIVRFAPTDSMRARREFLMQTFEVAVAAGASRISVADTAGVAGPGEISSVVSEITERFSVPVQVHCHNDLGLALANTLAGYEAGASILDATVNGLGERAGNTSLDELIVALEQIHGISGKFDVSGLTSLSAFVTELSGVRLSDMKPLVGHTAFAHKLDAHVRGVLRHPAVYEPLDPGTLGNERYFPLGKYSGPEVLRARFRQMGVYQEDMDLDLATERVREIATDQHSELTGEQVMHVAQEVKRSDARGSMNV